MSIEIGKGCHSALRRQRGIRFARTLIARVGGSLDSLRSLGMTHQRARSIAEVAVRILRDQLLPLRIAFVFASRFVEQFS